ncbi:type IV secretion system protein [Phenylobacterium sp. J367]|uniref:type IV secretion system protein n=1 Tax=Phenylobacterium sp. J367 TaxID=2898435 RepID=UPI002150FF5A|nr:type IV secretion system protein [Phenylobacterium sp. J367]
MISRGPRPRRSKQGSPVVIDLIKHIGDLAQQNAGFGALMHIDMIIVAAVAAIGILLAFIILAIEIAVTIIEFYIVTLIAFVVVPFGVLSQTSFLAEKAIGYVVSVGFKFMALAVIAGVGINIFETYTLSPQPTVAEEAGLLLSAIFLMMLSLKVPAIAGAMISGGPQLNTGGALWVRQASPLARPVWVSLPALPVALWRVAGPLEARRSPPPAQPREASIPAGLVRPAAQAAPWRPTSPELQSRPWRPRDAPPGAVCSHLATRLTARHLPTPSAAAGVSILRIVRRVAG